MGRTDLGGVFFFQAEDGIRDLVTGVQTCALPIFAEAKSLLREVLDGEVASDPADLGATPSQRPVLEFPRWKIRFVGRGVATEAFVRDARFVQRSEERRVGKECRCGWAACE